MPLPLLIAFLFFTKSSLFDYNSRFKAVDGVYLFHLVRLFVRPPVRPWTEWCLFCFFQNTSRIHFIFTHPINQLQKRRRILTDVKNCKLNFRRFLKNCTFRFVLCPCNMNVKVDSFSGILLQQLKILRDDTSRWFTYILSGFSQSWFFLFLAFCFHFCPFV